MTTHDNSELKIQIDNSSLKSQNWQLITTKHDNSVCWPLTLVLLTLRLWLVDFDLKYSWIFSNLIECCRIFLIDSKRQNNSKFVQFKVINFIAYNDRTCINSHKYLISDLVWIISCTIVNKFTSLQMNMQIDVATKLTSFIA